MSTSPIPQITGPFQYFFKKIVAGGFLLFSTTLIAMVWCGFAPEQYQHFWHTSISLTFGNAVLEKSLVHWIDELLMAIFFFTVGLEIKREILIGELSSVKKAVLPVAAALGGMVVPALIFYFLNKGTTTANGWGIPMATDIAFALAVLSLLKNKVPYGVRIFLSALAIADDMGAVLVIAVFYTVSISWEFFVIAAFCLILLGVANRMELHHTLIYAILGIGVWFSFLGAGIHATVAGVVVAMFIPAQGRYDTDRFLNEVQGSLANFSCRTSECGHSILLEQNHLNEVQAIDDACLNTITPLQRLEHACGKWVTLVILPLFALANAGMRLDLSNFTETLTLPLPLGIILGLVIGKPLGIVVFSFITVKMLKVPLTKGVNWLHIIGAGTLAGIGFTMSIFITGLSYNDPAHLEMAKLGIICGSLVSAVIGLSLLAMASRRE